MKSIVRSCSETAVIKSLGDDNYTAFEAGWVGSSYTCRPDDSRHNDRGIAPLQILTESNETEVRGKAKLTISFYRPIGRKIIAAEGSLPEDGYVPTLG